VQIVEYRARNEPWVVYEGYISATELSATGISQPAVTVQESESVDVSASPVIGCGRSSSCDDLLSCL
jgi:uncharacterized membrane protein YcgQ (UPF0703/DUF1980 family)